jgi:hypothetical protein
MYRAVGIDVAFDIKFPRNSSLSRRLRFSLPLTTVFRSLPKVSAAFCKTAVSTP